MPVSDIFRRTKSMRLREPGLDPNKSDRRIASTTDLQDGKRVERKHRELQAPGAPSSSQVHDESPYVNRPSEEFFTNLIEHPYEPRRGPNHSLPSSPIDAGSPESFIGIALGNPEVDSLFIGEPEARQGYISNAASSFNSSATLHSGLATDEYGVGPVTPKEGTWASLTGRSGITSAAMSPTSPCQVEQTSPASPQPHHSKRQGASASGSQYTPPETTYQYRYHQDSATPASYPRAMEQQPRIGLAKKPSLLKRKMSWRRKTSRKPLAHMEPNCGSENSHSWPLSPLAPHIEHPDLKSSTMKQSVSDSNLAEVSLLHVEIPHIEMERYSVMFSNLLQAAEQPSLLTRRQGPLAKIKLATKTRTQLLQSTTTLPPTLPTIPSPTSPSSMPMPLSSARPARNIAANTRLEEGSPLRLPSTSDPPIRPKAGYSNGLAGSPDLLVTLRPSPDTLNDGNVSRKPSSRLHLSPPLGSSSPTSQPSTSPSSTSSPLVLPHRSSSLPTSRSPARINHQIPTPESLSPSTPSAFAPVEISIARQMSISRQQQCRRLVPITSSQNEPAK